MSAAAGNVCMSQNGQYQYICTATGNNVWISTNYGLSGSWYSVIYMGGDYGICTDTTGQYVLTSSRAFGDSLHISTNYGQAWSNVNVPLVTGYINNVSMSANRQYGLCAGTAVYISTNYCVSGSWFTVPNVTGSYCAMSSTGQYQYVSPIINGSYIVYVSTNYGASGSWFTSTYPGAGTYSDGLTSSYDGRYVFTSIQTTGVNCTYMSSNYGASGSFYAFGPTTVYGQLSVCPMAMSSNMQYGLVPLGGTSYLYSVTIPQSFKSISLALDNSQNLYVGGTFAGYYDSSSTVTPVNNLAFYKSATNQWSRITSNASSGVNGNIYAMSYDTSNNLLYVGGNFTDVTDNTTKLCGNIAVWNPNTTAWSVLGNSIAYGVSGQVNALQIDAANKKLYVGGAFTSVNDASSSFYTCNNLAIWDTGRSIWFPVGFTGNGTASNGTNAPVNTLALNTIQNNLYVGGAFTQVQDASYTTTATNIAVASYNLNYNTTYVRQTYLSNFQNITAVYSIGGTIPVVAPATNSTAPFSYAVGNTLVATIAGTTLSIGNVGTTTLTATELSSSYFYANTISSTLTITPANPGIGALTLPTQVYSIGGTYSIPKPTSSSDGSFAYTSGNLTVGTIAGNVFSIGNVGTSTITATQSASGNYGSYSVSGNLVITQGDPSLGSLNLVSQVYATGRTYTLPKPTTFSDGSFAYTSGNTQVGTVIGNTFYIGNVGTTKIIATQSASGNYGSYNVSGNLVITQGDPNLGSLSLVSQIYATGRTYTLPKPTTFSDGSFAYTSGNTQVGTVIGNTFYIGNVGTTKIIATQSASGNYGSYSVSGDLVITQGDPNLGSLSLVSQVYATGRTYTLPKPTTFSDGSFAYTSGNLTVGTVIGNTFYIGNVGTTKIIATQSASGNYGSYSVSSDLVITVGDPILGSLNLVSQIYATGRTYTLPKPTTFSDGSFAYTSGNTTVGTVISNTFYIGNVGTTKIIATQSASGNYGSYSVSGDLAITQGDASLGSLNLVSQVYATGRTYTLPKPTTFSDGSFAYTSGNTLVGTVIGNTFYVGNVGTTKIIATQSASGNYASYSVSGDLAITLGDVSLGSLNLVSQVYATGKTYTLPKPTTFSDGSFAYTSGNTTVGTVIGNTFYVGNVGTTKIIATQSASGNYGSYSVSGDLVITAGDASLGSLNLISQIYATGLTYTLPKPTTFSDGSFAYTSGNTTVGTVIGNTFYVGNVGTTKIIATQSASGNYGSYNVSGNLVITQGDPSLGSLPLVSQVYATGRTYPLPKPTTFSDGSFAYTSGNLTVGTVIGTTFYIGNVGTTKIIATQSASGNYGSYSVSGDLVITQGDASLGSLPLVSQMYSTGKTYTLPKPTTFSDGSFAYTSGNTTVGTVIGNTFYVGNVGTTTITATQSASGNYGSYSVSGDLAITQGNPSLGSLPLVSQIYATGRTYTLPTPSSSSDGSFAYTSGNTTVGTVTGNTFYIGNVGTTTITATQSASGNYGSYNVSGNLVISQGDPSLGSLPLVSQVYTTGGTYLLPKPTSTLSDGSFSYTSGNTLVGTVIGTTFYLGNVGNTTITATQSASGNYASYSVTANLQITKGNPNMGTFTIPAQTYVREAQFQLTAPSSSSTAPITYISNSPAIASVFGNTVTILNPGVATITAYQSANSNFVAGSSTGILNITSTVRGAVLNEFTTVAGIGFDISLNGNINCSAIDNSNSIVYFGGTFSQITYYSKSIASYSIPANQLGFLDIYNIATTNGNIYSSVYDNSNNIFYVGGNFTTVYDICGSKAANNIARWNVGSQTWSVLGNSTINGTNVKVYSMAVDASYNLYVGGSNNGNTFYSNNGNVVGTIAQWSPTVGSWSTLGNLKPTTSTCYTMTYDVSNNLIYAGGNFVTFSNLINYYNITAAAGLVYYYPLNNSLINYARGTGVSDALYYSNGVTTYTPTYTSPSATIGAPTLNLSGGVTTQYLSIPNYTTTSSGFTVALWFYYTGTASQNLPLFQFLNGGNYYGIYIAPPVLSNNIYFSLPTGNFSTAYSVTSNTWYHLAATFNSNSTITLYINGTSVKTTTSTYLSFTSASFYIGNDNTGNYFTGNIGDFRLYSSLLTAAQISSIYSVKNSYLDSSANSIAKWNISAGTWSVLGVSGYNGITYNNRVYAMAFDTLNNLYVGGSFANVYDPSNSSLNANNIAVWNSSSNSWKLLGNSGSNGTASAVTAIAIDGYNNAYVAGASGYIYDASGSNIIANCISMWNTNISRWSVLGGSNTSNGFTASGTPLSMVFDATQTYLYISVPNNSRITAYDTSGTKTIYSGLIKYNTVTGLWSDIDFPYSMDLSKNSVNGTLSLNTTNNSIFIGGVWSTITQNVNNIFSYNCNSGRINGLGVDLSNGLGVDLSNGTTVNVRSMVVDPSANLYVGGSFVNVYDGSNTAPYVANNVAKWNVATSSWSLLGNAAGYGVSGSVLSMVYDTSNAGVYLGGNIFTVNSTGTAVNNVVKWNVGSGTWSVLGNVSGNGISNVAPSNFTPSTNLITNKLNNVGSYNPLYPTSEYIGSWGAAAISYTGQYQIAVSSNPPATPSGGARGYIYTSSYYGLSGTWIKHDEVGYQWFGGMAVSKTGQYQYVNTMTNVTDINKSTNYGLYGTWFSTNNTGIGGAYQCVQSICTDDTGRYVLSLNGANEVYLSSNYGEITSVKGESTYRDVYYRAQITATSSPGSVSMSNNVKYGICAVGAVYVSTNYCVSGSWVLVPTVSGNYSAMSSNGQYQYVAPKSTGDYRIYISTNYGASGSWVISSYTSVTIYNDGSTRGLTTSPDGRYVFVGASNQTNNGGFFSSNYGASGSFSSFGPFVPGTGAAFIPLVMSGNMNYGLIPYVAGNNVGFASYLYAVTFQPTASVNALLFDNSQNLYVGGSFAGYCDSSSTVMLANNLAIYNPKTTRWSNIMSNASSGVNGNIYAMSYDTSNNLLYVGGNFLDVSDNTNNMCGNIAVWNPNTTAWSVLGN